MVMLSLPPASSASSSSASHACRDDVMVRIKLVKIFGDILGVPGIAAEAQYQRIAILRLIGRNINPGEPLAARDLERQLFRILRKRPRVGDGVRREDEMTLKFEHQDYCRGRCNQRKEKARPRMQPRSRG